MKSYKYQIEFSNGCDCESCALCEYDKKWTVDERYEFAEFIKSGPQIDFSECPSIEDLVLILTKAHQ